MEFVIRQHYHSMVGRVVIKNVICENICTDVLSRLSTLNPYSFEATYAEGPLIHDSFIGSIPLIAVQKQNYPDIVLQSIQAANKIYQDFINSNEGNGFKGEISIIGDSIGSIVAFDALRMSSKNADKKFSFDVSDVFTFGSPIGLILSSEMLQKGDFKLEEIPVRQFYNLFHPTDPFSCRIESLISKNMANISPVNIPRPRTTHFIHLHPHVFLENESERRSSDASLQSKASGAGDIAAFNLQQIWWGSCRIDYALYCPEGLSNLALSALPHLFHSSYWESCDAVAFILRQVKYLIFDQLQIFIYIILIKK
uniref:CSON011146 protein n=1 Tax=Culicoides sonorensis TaxID=179676 RepID=A0A336M3T4_CULSO